jgi:adenine-specific DNA methylase
VLVERVAAAGKAREICVPTPSEIQQAECGWVPRREFDAIPKGQETTVLLRHGFTRWGDLYPSRQRVLLEELLDVVAAVEDRSAGDALAWAALGVAEMAGRLSRWDRWYLKSVESMAGHRFNFTTLTVEPNVWGAGVAGRGTMVRRVALIERAAVWMEQLSARPRLNQLWRQATGGSAGPRAVVAGGSSERLRLPDSVVDICLTDPPYHDDVQYDELSIPLRLWAGMGGGVLDGQAVAGRGRGGRVSDAGYSDVLRRVFTEVRRVLKPHGHLVFSYANRAVEAWISLMSALESAGFECVGVCVVFSENETDAVKRGVRACAKDLLIDLVPRGAGDVRRLPIAGGRDSAEDEFLAAVGEFVLRVGNLGAGWQEEFRTAVGRCIFLRGGVGQGV